MQIAHVEFEFLDRTLLPRWTMRIRVVGEDFEQRAVPIVAEVGSLSVEGIMPLLDGNGVQGFLVAEPNTGDELRIGYADGSLIDTGMTYNPAIA